MIRRKKDQIEWLEFEQLQEFPEIVHGVFLRQIDCSLNLNRQIIQDILGLEKLEGSKQVHGDLVLEAADRELECDGIVTSERNRGLLIAHADCQAAIFYDPIKKVIANVHSGWRGTVKNIYGKTVDYLKQNYGSNPLNLIVCIAPSLGPSNAEFVNHRLELPQEFRQFQVRENYFDFWEIARMQLCNAGVLNSHIEISGICTFSAKNDFFSYRREKKTGRNGTVVALKH